MSKPPEDGPATIDVALEGAGTLSEEAETLSESVLS